MGKFKEYGLPCPCGSGSDPYALDFEGGGYCFSCGTYFPPYKNHNKEELEDFMIDITYDYYPYRGLTKKTVEFYDILTRFHDGEPYSRAFRYNQGKVKVKKYAPESRRDKYSFPDGAPTEPFLYGMDKFTAGSKKVVYITEGEDDAPSIWQAMGGTVAAVSIQTSVTALRDIKHCREYLNSFDKIVLAFDADEAGRKALQQVICSGLFDFNKLYYVDFKLHKDANEYLQNSQVNELVSELKTAKKYTPDNIISTFEEIREALKEGKENTIGTYPTESLNHLLYGLYRGQVVLLKAQSGVGKQLPNTTPIPTPEGYTLMGDLKVGDKVFGADGNPCTITYVTETQYDIPCYEIVFADGTRQISGGPHRWGVYDPNGYYRVKTTEELYQEGPIHNGRTKYSIDIAKPLQLPEIELPIEPYLLGLWLGDGHSYSADISVGKDDPEEFEKQVKARGHEIVACNQDRAGYRYRISGLTHKMLKTNNLLKNKHIPRIYFRASEHQRRELLRGLMDSDGGVSGKGYGVEFYNSDKRLFDECVELQRTLGLKVFTTSKQSRLYGADKKIAYRSWALTSGGDEVFSYERKKSKVKPVKNNRRFRKTIREIIPVPSIPSKCIQVDSPDHLYLCGDHYTVTHNTEMFRLMEDHLLKTSEVRLGVIHMEEDKATTIKGFATYELGIPCNLPDSGIPDDQIIEAYQKAVGGKEDRVYIYTMFGGDDPDDVLDSIRFLVASAGVDIVFLDHITLLVTGTEEGDERRKLDYLSTKLKKMAKELNFCLVMISHVNDDGQTRGSRNIEKIADTIIHLWRDKLSEDEIEKNTLRMTVEKNRLAGRTGQAEPLYFNTETFKLQTEAPL